ncbi:hypothetical protein ACAX43_22535 [Paraburkholderia sp. IW21]|uniref:hypothetical protein n=1 Tax=Paraburkholderia sp. IW21 TaxID=3242488 RepID=UPI003522ADD8
MNWKPFLTPAVITCVLGGLFAWSSYNIKNTQAIADQRVQVADQRTQLEKEKAQFAEMRSKTHDGDVEANSQRSIELNKQAAELDEKSKELANREAEMTAKSAALQAEQDALVKREASLEARESSVSASTQRSAAEEHIRQRMTEFDHLGVNVTGPAPCDTQHLALYNQATSIVAEIETISRTWHLDEYIQWAADHQHWSPSTCNKQQHAME